MRTRHVQEARASGAELLASKQVRCTSLPCVPQSLVQAHQQSRGCLEHPPQSAGGSGCTWRAPQAARHVQALRQEVQSSLAASEARFIDLEQKAGLPVQ